MNKQSSFLSKTIALVTILLFIGAGVTPNISGYDKKTSIQLLMEAPASFTSNDNYVNIYLKFDEGTGNTAGDSSGHDYDGKIYGATWTTGKYGYALDFDGANDYVDLGSYAKNKLGMNKTDDLKFSFYFKTTSTKKGVIYSMCRGDAYGYNPGFQIALNSNGTIELQVWRLSCGILISSSDSYNDGEWHYAEIYYNGVSDNPHVDIIVDGDLDTSYEKYVCEFFSDQFRYAEIGRHSYELDYYFEGALDEFKIIKYPGGNEQEPPIIDGPTIGQPDIEYDYSFITNDPEEDDILLYINWDDGTIDELGPYASGQEVIVSHTWYEEGSYEVKARSIDIWDYSRMSDPYLVRIGDQAPDRPTITGQKYGDPNQQIEYTFVSYDFEEEDIKYFIDWGDGTTTETGYYPSGTPFTESHSWETKKDYYIKARAIDIKNKIGEWAEHHIRIGDKPPNQLKIYGAVQGIPRVEYVYAFIATDPENDNISIDIDWGNGDIETDVGPIPSGEILVRSHSWNRTRAYIIKARAKDEFDYYTSSWTEFNVIIPRNKVCNFNLLELLFERFPNAFPILRNIFKFIK